MLIREFKKIESMNNGHKAELAKIRQDNIAKSKEIESKKAARLEFEEEKENLLKKLATIQAEIKNSESLTESISSEIQYLYETKKSLNNKIQEKKGNIRVYCRIKPQEIPINTTNAKDFKVLEILEDQSTLNVNVPNDTVKSDNTIQNYRFYFEKIFGENSNQSELFNEMAQLLQSVLDGYNVCIFAYGQTGSGKTYTMEGGTDDNDSKGLIPRSVEYLYENMKNLETLGWNFKTYASFQEVYKEQVLDPLQDSNVINGEPKQCKMNIKNRSNSPPS